VNGIRAEDDIVEDASDEETEAERARGRARAASSSPMASSSSYSWPPPPPPPSRAATSCGEEAALGEADETFDKDSAGGRDEDEDAHGDTGDVGDVGEDARADSGAAVLRSTDDGREDAGDGFERARLFLRRVSMSMQCKVRRR